jgi:hypothetical protein
MALEKINFYIKKVLKYIAVLMIVDCLLTQEVRLF